jgi:hypothetical protein
MKTQAETLLVGSKAVSFYDPAFRIGKDKDYFCFNKEDYIVLKACNNDCFFVNNEEVKEQLLKFSVTHCDGETHMSPYGLYNLKISHGYFDKNWWKHTKDIIYFQTKWNLKEVDTVFQNVLEKFWREHYKDKKEKITLQKTKDEFFNSKVERQFDHDYLHEAVAYHDKPLFKTILKDGEDVFLDINKFNNLSEDDKIKLAREEIYALALERFILTGKEKDLTKAYRECLKLVVTRLSKGWFPRFILTRLSEMKNPDINYKEKFEKYANYTV